MEPTTRNDTQTTACRRQSSMRKTLSLALASSFMRGRCAKPSSTARAVPATRARPHRQTELACSSGAVHTSRQWTGRDQHGRHGSGSQTPKTGKNKSSRSTVRVVCYRQIHTVALTLALVTVVASEGKEQRKHVLQWSYCDVSGRAKAGRTSNLRDRASFPGKRPRCPFLLLAYAPFRPFATALHIALVS